MTLASSVLEAVRGADAAVIVTEWGEFRTLASGEVRSAMATPLIVDGRNLLDPRPGAGGGISVRVGGTAQRGAIGVIAVLLVGGEGTRLRPLTEWLPKPMLPIANRPFLEHQIGHLREHGIDRVVLSCGYLAGRDPRALRGRAGVRGRAGAAGDGRGDPVLGREHRRDVRRLQR